MFSDLLEKKNLLQEIGGCGGSAHPLPPLSLWPCVAMVLINVLNCCSHKNERISCDELFFYTYSFKVFQIFLRIFTIERRYINIYYVCFSTNIILTQEIFTCSKSTRKHRKCLKSVQS